MHEDTDSLETTIMAVEIWEIAGGLRKGSCKAVGQPVRPGAPVPTWPLRQADGPGVLRAWRL